MNSIQFSIWTFKYRNRVRVRVVVTNLLLFYIVFEIVIFMVDKNKEKTIPWIYSSPLIFSFPPRLLFIPYIYYKLSMLVMMVMPVVLIRS